MKFERLKLLEASPVPLTKEEVDSLPNTSYWQEESREDKSPLLVRPITPRYMGGAE